jgi:8-oxo-dGTP pyrophosphatase MutT (NUDIX family)
MDLINDMDRQVTDVELSQILTTFSVSHKISDAYYRLLLPLDDRTHGLMLEDTVKRMPWTSDFSVNHNHKVVKLNDAILESAHSNNVKAEKVNSAFQKLIDLILEQNTFDIMNKRHSEPYLLPGARYPVCRLERFTHALFGICARGSHLTAYTYAEPKASQSSDPGFVVQGKGELKVWVAKRSEKLFTYPGKLDSTVAGGVKSSQTPTACILAEADEEASLDEAMVAARIVPVGTMTYVTSHGSFKPAAQGTIAAARQPGRESGLISPEILYLYDLLLPPDVIPKPHDDEVEGFRLMSVPEVKAALFNDEFKTNSAVVMIDFFVRHGVLVSDASRGHGESVADDYVEIVSRMHRRLPVATGPSWEE